MFFQILSVFFFVSVFSEVGFSSVYLYNDSPFILKAQVVAANGIEIGEKLLQPQQLVYVEDQIGSSDPTHPVDSTRSFQNYKNSLTPYQVFWYCAKGDGNLYASCPMIAAGATVMATTRSGPCYCKPPKEKEKKSKDAYKEN